MLFMSTKLAELPLLSLRSSARVGTVHGAIINPHNLHIDAFWCASVHSNDKLVVLDVDIRELSSHGIVIDDHLNLSDPADLVRLQPVIALKFELIDKAVYAGKRKIGKVAEYAIDHQNLFVKKLYVQPVIWQSISQSRLVIDRQSIIEVTDDRIVVSGPEQRAPSAAEAVAAAARGYSSSAAPSASTISE